MSSASSKNTESLSDLIMVEVPKDFFFEGMQLPTAVYLRMTPGNYLVIGKKGDRAAFSTLHAYNKKETCIYVKNFEYAVLIQHVTNVTEAVVQQKNIPDLMKLKFIGGLADDATKTLEASGFTSVAKVQKVSQLLMQMSQKMSAFQDIIAILETLPNEDSKHSMTTCLISMLLCEEMRVSLPMAQEKCAMGALLHDIGLKSVPKCILDKPQHLWTREELQVYEQHPIRAVEMLRDAKDVPSDVLLIIAEHHENSSGTGFPKRIRDVKISPLGKIVGLANYLASLLLSRKPDGSQYTPDEAVSYIEDIIGQPFNKQCFLALKNIINKKHLADKI